LWDILPVLLGTTSIISYLHWERGRENKSSFANWSISKFKTSGGRMGGWSWEMLWPELGPQLGGGERKEQLRVESDLSFGTWLRESRPTGWVP
jgi:hypothetical protein